MTSPSDYNYESGVEAASPQKVQYVDEEGVQVTIIREQERQSNATSKASVRVVPSEEPQDRQSKKCCGCCCDFRRAVIICSILLVVFNVFSIIILFASDGAIVTGSDGGAEYDDFIEDYTFILMGIEGVSVLTNALAVVGAMRYSVWMVIVSTVWLVVEYGAYVGVTVAMCNEWEQQDYYVETDYYYYSYDYECSLSPGYFVVSFVAMLCWIYPFIGFAIEVGRGALSAQNYVREEYSCCCV